MLTLYVRSSTGIVDTVDKVVEVRGSKILCTLAERMGLNDAAYEVLSCLYEQRTLNPTLLWVLFLFGGL